MDDPAATPAEAAERDAAVAALGRHFAAGRLDPAGYESRAIAAAAAVNRADLVALFAGLPATGPGFLDAGLRDGLLAEGLLFLAEDLPGAMIYRRYRAPGQRIFRRTVQVHGAVGVSRRRLVLWAAGAKRFDVPFAYAGWDAAVDVSVDRSGRLRVVGAVAPFHPDRSGRIEYRLDTGRADEIVALIRSMR